MTVVLPEAKLASDEAARRVAGEPEVTIEQLEAELTMARDADLPLVAGVGGRGDRFTGRRRVRGRGRSRGCCRGDRGGSGNRGWRCRGGGPRHRPTHRARSRGRGQRGRGRRAGSGVTRSRGHHPRGHVARARARPARHGRGPGPQVGPAVPSPRPARWGTAARRAAGAGRRAGTVRRRPGHRLGRRSRAAAPGRPARAGGAPQAGHAARRRGGPTDVEAAADTEPDVDEAGIEADTAAESPAAQVDDIFARIRAGQAEQDADTAVTDQVPVVAALRAVEAESEAAEAAEGAPAKVGKNGKTGKAEKAEDDAEAAEPTPESVELSLLEKRDGVVAEVEARLAKRMKRVLSDEQSSLLDEVRRSRRKPTAEQVLPGVDEQRLLYIEAATEELRAAVIAGVRFAGDLDDRSVVTTATKVDDIAEALAEQLAGPLRTRGRAGPARRPRRRRHRRWGHRGRRARARRPHPLLLPRVAQPAGR